MSSTKTGAHEDYVAIRWDDDAQVFYVAQTSVPGLNAEAKSVEVMFDVLRQLIPELLTENQPSLALDEIPFSVIFDQMRFGRNQTVHA